MTQRIRTPCLILASFDLCLQPTLLASCNIMTLSSTTASPPSTAAAAQSTVGGAAPSRASMAPDNDSVPNDAALFPSSTAPRSQQQRRPSRHLQQCPWRGISVAEAMNPARRSTMEDVCVVHRVGEWGKCSAAAPLNRIENHKMDNDQRGLEKEEEEDCLWNMAYIGIYDGHGGTLVTSFGCEKSRRECDSHPSALYIYCFL
jgi:hypothetical protein